MVHAGPERSKHPFPRFHEVTYFGAYDDATHCYEALEDVYKKVLKASKETTYKDLGRGQKLRIVNEMKLRDDDVVLCPV
eukprot:m.334108 g.334108  ORF g.334108 m.334108 type:complete len:79 (+) comp20505_c0_seq32:1398-1634(+)